MQPASERSLADRPSPLRAAMRSCARSCAVWLAILALPTAVLVFGAYQILNPAPGTGKLTVYFSSASPKGGYVATFYRREFTHDGDLGATLPGDPYVVNIYRRGERLDPGSEQWVFSSSSPRVRLVWADETHLRIDYDSAHRVYNRKARLGAISISVRAIDRAAFDPTGPEPPGARLTRAEAIRIARRVFKREGPGTDGEGEFDARFVTVPASRKTPQHHEWWVFWIEKPDPESPVQIGAPGVYIDDRTGKAQLKLGA